MAKNEVTGTGKGIGTIAVGVDGSEASLAALEWAREMALAVEARVVVVCAIRSLDALLRDSIKMVDKGKWRYQLSEEITTNWCSALSGSGVEFRVRVVDGQAVSSLARVALAEGADLMAVGVHQHHSLTSSVSAQLSRHAHCPVVAVPAPAEAMIRAGQVKLEEELDLEGDSIV